MKLKAKLHYLAAFLVIALPLILSGNAGARYMTDGAVPDGAGGWITPDDMVCIKGVFPDGTLEIVAGDPNSRECIYYNTGLTGMNPVDVTSVVHAHGDHLPVVKALLTYGACKDPGSGGNSSFVWDFVLNRCLDVSKCSGTDATTKGTLTWNAGSSTCSDSAACTVATGTAPNDGGKHALATSICVDGAGNGIPLTDLDRTFAMCAQKGGTWKQTSDSLVVSGSGASATAWVQVPATATPPGFGGACVAHSRQFKGKEGDPTALLTPFDSSSKGTNKGLGTSAANAGFCYATMDMTSTTITGGKVVGGYTSATCPAKDSSSRPNAGYTSADAYDWSSPSISSTGAMTFAASTKTITKPSGTSFVTSGFAIGDTITTNDTSNLGPFTITAVTATVITVAETTLVDKSPVSVTVSTYQGKNQKCTYAKGIAGFPNSTLTKVDGTTFKSTSQYVDLSLAPTNTMGGCLANGGTWNNWVGQPTGTTCTPGQTYLAGTNTCRVGTTASGNVSKIPAWDFAKQSPETTNGCLHCHSRLTQYNGPAERFKDSFLKHGHKNILRKVTPGEKWLGPDGEDYEALGATGGQTVNFTAGTAAGTYGSAQLLYIFGNWMTPAPDALNTIVNIGGSAKYNGGAGNNYKCAACHSTGWSNPSAGLCSLSSYTTKVACEGASPTPGTWYPMVGVQGIGTTGYTSAEPAASFSGVTFSEAGTWDLDGIRCARCHNATAPRVTDKQIADSAYPSTHVTSGGMGALANGVGRINLCFGCHQSIAKTNNGIGPDADLSHPENLPVTNAATAPDYLPEFVDSTERGSVIGNMFLNSVHAEFTGKIVPNALGKYDHEDPMTCVGTTCTGGNENGNAVAGKFKSMFQGFTCWQSATSTSPGQTMYDPVTKVITEIKSKTDCEKLYGAGAWRSDGQGTCATCHDVHNSLFVEATKEAALRKVCTDCHNKTLSPKKTINHPDGPGTPLGFMAERGWEACVTCHMPRPTSSASRMHLWRINPDRNYRTFPTATEFGIGATATKKIANSAARGGDYENAVWIDVDYVCGQCHGGSFGPTATHNGASYYDKMFLSEFAKGMHINAGPKASFTRNGSGKTVTLTDTSTDDSFKPDLCLVTSCYAITVNWGDKKSDNGNPGSVFSHTYAKAGRYIIIYSVKDNNGVKSSKTLTVTIR